MRQSVMWNGLVAALVLMVASSGRADPLPAWDYATSSSAEFNGTFDVVDDHYMLSAPNARGAASRLDIYSDHRIAINAGSWYISSGAPTVNAFELQLKPAANTFLTPKLGAYSLGFTVHDPSTDRAAELVYEGYFSGDITTGTPGQPGLTNTFTSKPTQTVGLGMWLFSVTLRYDPIILHGNDFYAGQILADVTVQPAQAPEPGSLGLLALGLPALTLLRRRAK